MASSTPPSNTRRHWKFGTAKSSAPPPSGDQGSRSTRFQRLAGYKARSATMEELLPDDIIIAVFGATGVGKSSFVNMLSGEPSQVVGHALESCTTTISMVELRNSVSQTKLVVVDTPGFDDTHKSDVQILEMLAAWLKATYKRKVHLSGILYLHRISDNRMDGTSLRNLRMFQKLCGKDALQNVLLVTTMWGDSDQQTEDQRELELKQDFWKSMLAQGSRTVRYANTSDSAWGIVDNFLHDNYRTRALQLQQELVDFKTELPETRAGQELHTQLERLIRSQEKTLKALSREIKQQHNDEALNALREEFENQRRDMDVVISEMGKLNIPFRERLVHLLTGSLRYFR